MGNRCRLGVNKYAHVWMTFSPRWGVWVPFSSKLLPLQCVINLKTLWGVQWDRVNRLKLMTPVRRSSHKWVGLEVNKNLCRSGALCVLCLMLCRNCWFSLLLCVFLQTVAAVDLGLWFPPLRCLILPLNGRLFNACRTNCCLLLVIFVLFLLLFFFYIDDDQIKCLII